MQTSPHKALRKNLILASLVTTMALAAMDNYVVSTAIPQIVGDLGSFSLFTWLFTIYLLIQTITIPLYGKLSDLVGRKPIIIFGIIAFLIGSALCGAAWNMLSLIVFRGLQAIGAGAILATVNTIAGDIYTIQERAKIQGWLSSVWGISAVIGPAIGGFFAEYMTWRWIFFINIPFGIISIILIVKYLHEPKPSKKPSIDWLGAIFMLITGTLLMYILLQSGQSWPWLSYTTLILSTILLLLFILVLKIERKAKEPIMPGWIWQRRVLIGANLGIIGMGMVMIGPNMYIPVFAQYVLGVGAISAGFILTSMSFTWPLSSGLSGFFYLRIGFRNTALIGTVLVLIGSIGFLFIQFPGNIVGLVSVQMLMGAGFGLIATPLLVGVQSTVGYEQRGVVTGTNMFGRYFGQSLGSAILAVVFNNQIEHKLAQAPASLQNQLPQVNEIVDAMKGSGNNPALLNFLREAFFEATHWVYVGTSIILVLTILILLWTPKKFPIVED